MELARAPIGEPYSSSDAPRRRYFGGTTPSDARLFDCCERFPTGSTIGGRSPQRKSCQGQNIPPRAAYNYDFGEIRGNFGHPWSKVYPMYENTYLPDRVFSSHNGAPDCARVAQELAQ